MKQKRKAFTLMEVIVVVAIIAVLMAMLIPSMLYVRKQAKKTSLLSQANRLKQSIDNYVSEYGAPPSVYTHLELKDHSEDITETENAFFAMQGGPVYDGSGDPPDIAALAVDVRNEDGGSSYSVATFGTGSIYKDDSGTSHRQSAFFRPQKDEMQVVKGTTGSDNYIPDLVDPVNGQPLLIYTAAPYPKDANGNARGSKYVRPVSYDDSGMGSSANNYGLVWRRLNDDFVAAAALTTGGAIMNQRDNSLLSDALLETGDPDHDKDSIKGASSNLAWFVMDWEQIAGNKYYYGNPNYIPNYDRHKVIKGYWIISPGYDGIYLNKEGNNKAYSKNYYHGHWSWSSGYTKYSTFEEEREYWFANQNPNLIFAHRWYSGTAKGESTQGRETKYDGPPESKKGGDDSAAGKRSLDVLTKNFDDIILDGGELDASVE